MGISLKNISYSHKGNNQTIMKNLNLEISDGETVAILGKSGSGKSTLFNLITSFYEAETGSIDFMNIKRESISYIRQSAMDMLFPWLTVKENIEFALKSRGQITKESKERITHLANLLNLSNKLNKKCYPSELSGGEKKRLSFACGLSYNPKLILLDEAFTGIDFSLKWELWSFLRAEIQRTKATALIITHDFDEAIFLADRIVFLNNEKKIDEKQVFVKKSDLFAIDKTLSEPAFIEAKTETLKIYKEINEANEFSK